MADLGKLFLSAKQAYERRNYDYAIELFRQILTLNPDHAEGRRALRVCEEKKYEDIGYPSKLSTMPLTAKTETQLKMQKAPDKVIEICEGHLAKDPRNIRVRLFLARALQEKACLDGAAAELEMAMKLQPDNVEILRTLGEIYTLQEKVNEARAVLNRAGNLAPQDRDIEKLRRDLEATATMKKGYDTDGDYKSAMKNRDQAEKLEQDQHMVKGEGQVANEASELDVQIASATSERDKVKFYKKKGELLEKSGDLDGARAAYEGAAAIDRMDTTLKDKTDDLQIRKLDAAYQAAVEKARANPKDANAIAAAKKLRMDKLKFEAMSWERRVKDRPTDIGAHFELGRRCYLTGVIDKAIAEFQQTVKDPKRKVDSHYHLGLCFRYKGMFDLAATQFSRAIDVGGLPQERELAIRYDLAKTLEKGGDLAKAETEYKTIMEQDINYKDVTKCVEEIRKKLNKPAQAAGSAEMPEE